MKVATIVVLYNPEKECLRPLIDEILQQTDTLYLIDNSSEDLEMSFDSSRVHYIPLRTNKGIAAAQNVAIREILLCDYDYILFGDQDSIMPPHAVEHMLKTFRLLEDEGIKVGAVGAKAFCKQTGLPYTYGPSMLNKEVVEGVSEVSYVMNSISIYKATFFRENGLMNEYLFIDAVDCEVCWRAAVKGYRFFIDNGVHIGHLLGLGQRRFLGRNLSITPPGRVYYQYRNFFWLIHCKYVPHAWLRYNGWKYLVKMFFYPILVRPRLLYAKNILKGLASGIKKSA